MSRGQKPADIFELTIADADRLVSMAAALTNNRTRRMRAELRDRVGEALKVGKGQRHHLDCIESSDLFVVMKPGSRLCRADFSDARLLLRQALVAACAAFETYIGDKVMSRVRPLMRSERSLTSRLRTLPLTVGDWIRIEATYQPKRRGLREKIVKPAVREMASTAPNQVGALLSLLGVDNRSRRLDHHRGVPRGTTVRELARRPDPHRPALMAAGPVDRSPSHR